LPDPREEKRVNFFRFSIYWALLTIGAYAYIGEKVPWLILHQLLPLIFVSVYAMTFRKAVIAVASCVFLIAMTWHVAFMPVDINEPIVQVQNSEELREVFSLINTSQHVAIASDDYWPLPWYYRGNATKKLSYYSKRVDESVVTGQDFDLVITRDDDTYASLPGFEKQRYKINYWFSYYDNKDRVLEYYFKRDGKMGSMNFDIFIKQPA
jgi:predicted membrane-bound mannosyltransferase